jgi:hypothetical protein
MALRRSGQSVQQVPPDPLALPRDPATDKSNRTDRQTVGLQDEPTVNLGAQVATNRSRFRTPVGRPGFWGGAGRLILQARRLDVAAPLAVGAGTIRRELDWPVREVGATGYMSWAANETGDLRRGRFHQVTAAHDYYVSSDWIPPNFDQWPVTGHKPALPADWRPLPSVMADLSTGWPVLAPTVPSFGARVPLRRPRGVVSVT